MKDLVAGVSPEVKVAVIADFLNRARHEPSLKLGGEEFLRQIEESLRGEGVSEDLIQYMSARERARLRPTAALARELFPIERLPDGAMGIYGGDLDEGPSRK